LQYAPFARGDVITKQGNKAHWLYILAFGDAEVLYEPPGGAPAQVIGALQAGQFFGEMALLTGDARAATVVAKTDVECYRLDRASFQELLAGKMQIAEEIKKVMGGRRGDLETARQAFNAAAPVAEAEVRFVSRIRRFLGMNS
jgi:CRP-like cAMP-binding protein